MAKNLTPVKWLSSNATGNAFVNTDGEVVANGFVTDPGPWDDIFGDASQGVGNAALDYEAYRDTPYKAYFFRSGQADELNWRFQMSHRWDPTSDVKFHLHIVPMANPPTVPLVFAVKGTYAWSTFGADFPAAASWTSFTGTTTIGLTDAFKQKIMACFTATPPADAHESCFLLINMARDTTGTDTYTTGKSGGTSGSNVCLLGADVHYRAAKGGTVSDPGA